MFARNALKSKNLVGFTVFNEDLVIEATKVFEVLIANGATRANKNNADLIVSTISNLFSVDMIITDKDGNIFRKTVNNSNEAARFAQEVADTLGTEKKVKILYPEAAASQK